MNLTIALARRREIVVSWTAARSRCSTRYSIFGDLAGTAECRAVLDWLFGD